MQKIEGDSVSHCFYTSLGVQVSHENLCTEVPPWLGWLVLTNMCPTQARSYIESLPHYPKKDFHKFFVGANSVAINLLEQLLTMDPDRRPTAEQALEHPYFTKYHILEDEVTQSA